MSTKIEKHFFMYNLSYFHFVLVFSVYSNRSRVTLTLLHPSTIKKIKNSSTSVHINITKRAGLRHSAPTKRRPSRRLGSYSV